MNLTKDQIEKLCEGFDYEKLVAAFDWYLIGPEETAKRFFALGRQHQAKQDAELCRNNQVAMTMHGKYELIEHYKEDGSKHDGIAYANASERSIGVK